MTEATLRELFRADCEHNGFGFGTHDWTQSTDRSRAICRWHGCVKTVALG